MPYSASTVMFVEMWMCYPLNTDNQIADVMKLILIIHLPALHCLLSVGL